MGPIGVRLVFEKDEAGEEMALQHLPTSHYQEMRIQLQKKTRSNISEKENMPI